jgi:hypothetical protein
LPQTIGIYKEIYFKELIHAITGAGKTTSSEKAGRLEILARVDVSSMCPKAS